LNIEFDLELGKQLVNELVNLWIETKVRCETIEDLVKQLKEK